MLVPITALDDNYIWLYGRENLPVIVVDVPDFAPLLAYLQQHQLQLEAVLLTHNHADHVGGVAELKQYFPDVAIFASPECADYATKVVCKGKIKTEHYEIEVIPSGGHTAQHVSYLLDGNLFCGDALFSAGCGRVFTGDYAQMLRTLQRFKKLPNETLVCAGHEYTLSNLDFAEAVFSNKRAVQNQKVFVRALRSRGKPSLPTTLGLEKQINPFLQVDSLPEFIRLRQAKDKF